MNSVLTPFNKISRSLSPARRRGIASDRTPGVTGGSGPGPRRRRGLTTVLRSSSGGMSGDEANLRK
eukprot:766173-Hanusia_phi.AAC.4